MQLLNLRCCHAISADIERQLRTSLSEQRPRIKERRESPSTILRMHAFVRLMPTETSARNACPVYQTTMWIWHSDHDVSNLSHRWVIVVQTLARTRACLNIEATMIDTCVSARVLIRNAEVCEQQDVLHHVIAHARFVICQCTIC